MTSNNTNENCELTVFELDDVNGGLYRVKVASVIGPPYRAINSVAVVGPPYRQI